VDDEHVVALVEAVHGAHFHAVHVLALDAVFGNDVSHFLFWPGWVTKIALSQNA
jgi:hypothetical protein